MPRGKPKTGRRQPGGGRKRIAPDGRVSFSLSLTDADLAYLRALRPDRNVSAAVRDVVARDRAKEARKAKEGV